MPPKKAGGKKGGKSKKKKDDGAEPPHDGSWERAVDSGVWEKPATDLPDANTWPTWGALRERVLIACKEIRICNTASLRDAFAHEVVQLSPPELQVMDLHGSSNLRNFVVSPMDSCPKLTEISLQECASLEYVMVQSNTARSLNLSKCPNLVKALIHCPKLTKLVMTDNPKLEVVMLWSDDLNELDLTGCVNIMSLKLQCPSLVESKVPPLKLVSAHVKPAHPPISAMLKENLQDSARVAADAQEREWKMLQGDSIIPHAYRPF